MFCCCSYLNKGGSSSTPSLSILTGKLKLPTFKVRVEYLLLCGGGGGGFSVYSKRSSGVLVPQRVYIFCSKAISVQEKKFSPFSLYISPFILFFRIVSILSSPFSYFPPKNDMGRFFRPVVTIEHVTITCPVIWPFVQSPFGGGQSEDQEPFLENEVSDVAVLEHSYGRFSSYQWIPCLIQ